MRQDNNLLSNILLNESKVRLTRSCSNREALLELESSCKEQPQVEIPAVNLFAGGVYARKVVIPKDTVLVGKIHKHDQINVLLSGTIQVATEDGVELLTAPLMFVSPAGVKRAGFTLTEVVWVTFHGTESEDLAVIEEEFIAPSYEEFDKLQLRGKHELDSNSSRSNDSSRLSVSST